MNQELIVGLVALGIPLFAVGYLMLRKNAGIFRMYLAMLLIGLGYLTATGSMNDIGRQVMGIDGMPAMPAADAPAPAAPAAPATPAP